MMGVTTMPRSYDSVKTATVGRTSSTRTCSPPSPTIDRPIAASRSSRTRSTRRRCGPTARRSRATTSKYTWDAIANGDDIYDPTGYTDIETVDCPDPKTAVVTFAEPYSGWKQLFGGQYGILPSHILEGKDTPPR